MDNSELQRLYHLLLHLHAHLRLIRDVSHEPTFSEMRDLKESAQELEQPTMSAYQEIGDRLDNSSEETQ